MATKSIKIDGNKFDVTYADDADLQRKLQYLRSKGGEIDVLEGSATTAAVHGVGQGATFGFSDELYGGWQKLFGDEDYAVARDRYRDKLQALREDHPVTFTAGELAGGMVIPGGAAGTAARGTKAMSTLGRTGRLVATGAAGGAAAGAGYNENPEDLIRDIGAGALIGGVASPVLGHGIPAVGNIGRRVTNVIGRNADEKATDLLAGRITAGGRTADEAADQLSEFGRRGMLLDLDEGTLGLASGIKSKSDDARAIINQAIDTRQKTALPLIRGAVSDASGTAPGTRKVVKKAIEEEQALAGQAYDDFINTTRVPVSTELAGELDKELIKPFVNRARIAYEASPDTPAWDGSGDIPLWILNHVKQSLWDTAEGARSKLNVTGIDKGTARTLDSIRKTIVAIADEAEPRYAPARRGVEIPGRSQDALKQGWKTKPTSEKQMDAASEMMEEGIDGKPLSFGEKTMLRLGMADRVLKDLNTGPGGEYTDWAGKIMTTANDQGPKAQRLQMMSQSPEHYSRLVETIGPERTFAANRGYLASKAGSKTAGKLEDVAEVESGVGAIRQASGALSGGGLLDTLRDFVESAMIDSETATRIAREMASNPSRERLRQIVADASVPEDIVDAIIDSIERGRTSAVTQGLLAPTMSEFTDPVAR